MRSVFWTMLFAWSSGLLYAADAPPQNPWRHSAGVSVSWIGNTFSGGDAGWVPQDVQDICVTPDGTVYTTVGWEEHRGNIAAFKDGQLLQQSAHWKRGGIDRLVGETIAANATHIFFATGISGPGDHDGKVSSTFLARRDRTDIAARKPERRVAAGARIVGVAASAERVFAACADGRVRVFDTDLNLLRDWAASSPGEIAVDAQDHVWLIDTSDRALRRFDWQGTPLPQQVRFPEDVIAVDVAATPHGKLLVADGGVNRQVRIYRHLDVAPELEGTLGEPGGGASGPKGLPRGTRRQEGGEIQFRLGFG